MVRYILRFGKLYVDVAGDWVRFDEALAELGELRAQIKIAEERMYQALDHAAEQRSGLLTTKELSESLQIGVHTIQQWTKGNLIPYIPIGMKQKRYNQTAVLKALERYAKRGEHSPIVAYAEKRSIERK